MNRSKHSRASLWFLACLNGTICSNVCAAEPDWPMAGQNLGNTRFQGSETAISPTTVSQLRPKWATELRGSVLATPAVDGGSVYVPDYAGFLYRIDAETGKIVWQFPVSNYSDIKVPPENIDSSRVTPALTETTLIFGTQSGGPQAAFGGHGLGPGAWLVAVNKRNGEPRWRSQVEKHPAARINQPAVVYLDRVYVGITSWEETIAAITPDYPCCSFRGSVVAADRDTGKVIWQTYMAPEGYSGNALWGSSPVVDPKRNSLYITTGNNYMLPRAAMECVAKVFEESPSNPTGAEKCYPLDNYFDAIVALDLATGAVKWAYKTVPFDAHTHACIAPRLNPRNCPSPRGPDYDFGQGPMLFTAGVPPRDLLGAGQKSGVFWALNPDDGKLVWQQTVGPGGMTGGIQWGSAVDGKRVYIAVANYEKTRWPLQRAGIPTGEFALRGFWSALDASSGRIEWQTSDPNAMEMDQGMLTVANGVLFAGSMAGGNSNNNMFALEAASGKILWRFPSIGSVASGAAVVNGRVYWGSGYLQWGGTAGNQLFAFELMNVGKPLKAQATTQRTPVDARKLLPLW